MTTTVFQLVVLTACWFSASTLETVSVADRPAHAPGGSVFIRQTYNMSEAQREDAIYRAVVAGNIPEFLRTLKPVSVTGRTKSGRTLTATFYVMPDYLAVGSDRDFIRVPMNPLTAQRIADHLGMFLPTTKMVDTIYRRAETKLRPAPLPPGPQMTTSPYFWQHHQKVESQRTGRLGALIAGHKKDVVITNRLDTRPGRVAIYGWHRPSGEPIQPLSLVHHDKYADYSHGIRLIGPVVRVGDSNRNLEDVLQDPELAPLLSSEGVIKNPKIRLPVSTASL